MQAYLRRCKLCSTVFLVCRACGFNRRYCSDSCSLSGRKASVADAHRKDRCSDSGRERHRLEEAERRQRKKMDRVGDQLGQENGGTVTGAATAMDGLAQKEPMVAQSVETPVDDTICSEFDGGESADFRQRQGMDGVGDQIWQESRGNVVGVAFEMDALRQKEPMAAESVNTPVPEPPPSDSLEGESTEDRTVKPVGLVLEAFVVIVRPELADLAFAHQASEHRLDCCFCCRSGPVVRVIVRGDGLLPPDDVNGSRSPDGRGS